ncbi:hypothetical protein HELRODRAFT_151879, partial [Helobdella robusta]|uniref:RRM domain-containing protein n=1 Tax=Helobdella robusta TaxID=6412 RepID=T1EKM4_HELRO
KVDQTFEKLKDSKNKMLSKLKVLKTLEKNIVSSPLGVHERSIFIENVELNTTVNELKLHFKACGPIVRATIISDKLTGQPKGYAYMEFWNKSSIDLAMTLNGSFLRGRTIKVMCKRPNKHQLTTTTK